MLKIPNYTQNCGINLNLYFNLLKLLETSSIFNFPEGVIVGYSDILDDLSGSLLTPKELDEWNTFTNNKRKKEFIAARVLFRTMLNEMGYDLEFEICKQDSGKPYAINQDSELFVSFSILKMRFFVLFLLNMILD